MFSGLGDGGWDSCFGNMLGEAFIEVELLRLEGALLVKGLGRDCGGLPQTEGAGDRSCTGLGEIGTPHRYASSGRSSSSSSHSASSSFTDLRVVCCHDCLRLAMLGEGETSRLRELLRERVRDDEEGILGGFDGEGDRERRPGAARLAMLVMLASEGAEGEVNPRLIWRPPACRWEFCWRTALLTWPLRLG